MWRFVLLTTLCFGFISSTFSQYPPNQNIGLFRHDTGYKGDILYEKPHGYGIESYVGNCQYYGEFYDGEKTGYGIMRCPNEDTFSYYINGKFCTGTSSIRGDLYGPNTCNQYQYGTDDHFIDYISRTSRISYRMAVKSSITAKMWLNYLSRHSSQDKTKYEQDKTKYEQDKTKYDAYDDDILIAIYKKIRKSTIKNKTYYADILGIDETTYDKKIIRKQYLKISSVVHPDKNKKIDFAVANIVFAEVNEAYSFFMKK